MGNAILFRLCVLVFIAWDICASQAAVSLAEQECDYAFPAVNRTIEGELAHYLGAFSSDERNTLRSFIAQNESFEQDNTLFLRYASYFLESQNIEATYQVLKDQKEHAQDVVEAQVHHARAAYNNREALAHSYVTLFEKRHSVAMNKRGAQTAQLIVGDPLAITLAYLSPSLEISSLLNHALMYATTRSSGLLCRALLSSGANPNFQDKRGWTPLIRLAARRHCLQRDVAQFDQWKMQEEQVRFAGDYGEPPLFGFVPLLTSFGADVNKADNEGITPLHAACLHANVSMVQQLLQGEHDEERGVQLSLLTRDGYTPLMLAGQNSHVARSRQCILIYAGEYAQRNMLKLTESDEFARNMPYATKESAQKNEEHLKELARKNVLKTVAKQHRVRNVACALRHRELGIQNNRKLVRVMSSCADDQGSLPPWPKNE